jgi:hypothetical protein
VPSGPRSTLEQNNGCGSVNLQLPGFVFSSSSFAPAAVVGSERYSETRLAFGYF